MRENINLFSVLRLDYYLAGRQLRFSKAGIHYSIGIMLGYVIEESFKQGLMVVEESGIKLSTIAKKELDKHNLVKLYSECQNHGIFKDVNVSEDFLDLASNNLNCRYPSQIRKILDRANHIDPYLLTVNVGDTIGYYDDLICKLDDSLIKHVGDFKISIGNRAASNAGSATGRLFFHCNTPALKRLAKYTKAVIKERPNHNDDIKELQKGENHLWEFEQLENTIGPQMIEFNSEKFRYKTAEEAVQEKEDETIIISY